MLCGMYELVTNRYFEKEESERMTMNIFENVKKNFGFGCMQY